MAFTVENISSVQLLSDVALSPDGSKVVYRVTPSLRTGEYSAVCGLGELEVNLVQGHTRQLPFGTLPTQRKPTAQSS